MAVASVYSLNTALDRLFKLLHIERKAISAIYFYAVLTGILTLSIPLGLQSIINFVLGGAFSTSLTILIIVVVTGVLLTGILQVLQLKINERIQQDIFVQYSFEFAQRIPRLDMLALDGYYMPELLNRFFDTISLQKGLSKILLDLPIATIQIIFGIALLSFYNASFIIFGLLLLIVLVLIIRFTSRQGFESSMRESDQKYQVASWLQEMGRTMKSMKFARESNLHLHKADHYISGYIDWRTKHFRVLLTQYWAMIGFKVFITVSMLVVGAFLLIQQELNVGQFVAVEIVILTVLGSIEKFIFSLDKVYDVLTSIEKLGKVIDKPMEKEGTLELKSENGLRLEVNNLSFTFPSNNKLVLQNVNLSIPAGSVVCIEGEEGSGKSTLLKLLTGAYTQFEGQILINQLPIGNFTQDSLRGNIGMVFSQQEIFEGTVWENITLGNSEYSVNEIVELADRIGLKPYISSLRLGFDTVLEPLGGRLNRAATNRLLILRAIAGKPKMLLLENPLEGFSDQSAIMLTNFLMNEMKDCTIIATTNNEYFKSKSDFIYKLDKGIIS
jgi:ABC-type bacteriocin/lantibiotic exporter with double-glycine peptidase domain